MTLPVPVFFFYPCINVGFERRQIYKKHQRSLFTHIAFNRIGNSIGALYLVIEEKVGQA